MNQPLLREAGYRAVQATGRFGRLYTRTLAPALFVHINKTGGTSIEAALRLPSQHRTAVQMRETVGAPAWRSKLSFAVVRNPWDKVASQYHYRLDTGRTGPAVQGLSLSEWVSRAYGEPDSPFRHDERMFSPQLDWIADPEGRIIVDRVLRFESLAREFADLCAQLGLAARLPHLRGSDNPDYRRDYDDTAAELIARIFAPDISRFGYEFDDGPAVLLKSDLAGRNK